MQFLQHVPEILREPVSHWWERAQASRTLHDTYLSLPGRRREELMRVVAASEFAASALIQDPGALAWANDHRTPDSASAANAEYERLAAAAAISADALKLLRRWRRREMLRIAWRDIVAAAWVRETLRDVSILADACIRAAARAARDATGGYVRPAAHRRRRGGGAGGARDGQARRRGAEFLLRHRSRAAVSGGAARPMAREPIDNQEYFTRLGRELIRCSTHGRRMASCSASTCGCGPSATAGRWS